MLDAPSDKFEKILKKLRGQGVLTEQNIGEALKEVRLALSFRAIFMVIRFYVTRARGFVLLFFVWLHCVQHPHHHENHYRI